MLGAVLTRLSQITLPGAITDVVLQGERALAALATELVVIERGAVLRRLDVAVQALIASDDERSVLTVSRPIDPPAHYPLREISAAPQRPIQRRVHRLAAPWRALEDLGPIAADGWCATFDGDLWPTLDGDTVYLYERSAAGLTLRARHDTFWPCHLERVPAGVWLELSSLGASHFEVLALPDLRLLESGNLKYCPLQFPPEQIRQAVYAPTLAQPLFSIDAAGMPRSIQDGQVVVHPIRGVDRIVTQEGQIVTTLAAPSLGLCAEGERALCWAPCAEGIEVLLICLRTARVRSRLTLPGGAAVGARLFGPRVALWSGRTLQILVDDAAHAN